MKFKVKLLLTVSLLAVMSATLLNLRPTLSYTPQVGDQFEYKSTEYNSFNMDLKLYFFNQTTNDYMFLVHEIRTGFDDFNSTEQLRILNLNTPPSGEQIAELENARLGDGKHVENVTRDFYDPVTNTWDNSTADDENHSDSFHEQFRGKMVVGYNDTYFPISGPMFPLGLQSARLSELFPGDMFFEAPNDVMTFNWSISTFEWEFEINGVKNNYTIIEVFGYGSVTVDTLNFTFMNPPPPPENQSEMSSLSVGQTNPPPPPPPPNVDIIGHNVSISIDVYFDFENETGFLLEYGEFFFLDAPEITINGTFMLPHDDNSPPSLAISQESGDTSFEEVNVEGNGSFYASRDFVVSLTKHSSLFGGHNFTDDDLFSQIPEQTEPESSPPPSNTSSEDNNNTNNATSPNTSLPVVTPGYDVVGTIFGISTLVGIIVVYRKRTQHQK